MPARARNSSGSARAVTVRWVDVVSARESPLRDRAALVTGATRGIGRAVVELLREHGVRVGLVARDAQALDALAARTGGLALPCDVTDAEAVRTAVDRFEAWAGGAPELAVTCAGTFSLDPVEALLPDELERSLRVNLMGSVFTVQAVLPAMRERGRGTLVQVGSVAGRRAFPANAAYSAAKFGLRGFHEVLLEELRGSGVRATLLEPAATDTPLWDPLDPDTDPELPNRAQMLRPEEVAEAVLFAATRPDGVRIPFLPIERA